MDPVVVDTDVYSYLSSSNQKRAALYQPHVAGRVLALSFISVGELYAGNLKKIALGEWDPSCLIRLETRLRLFSILPYDVEVCKAYGEIKSIIKNPDGTDRTIAPNDLWIAACARRHGLTLITNNGKHFKNIPGVNIICEAESFKQDAGGAKQL
jgi:tRNA(fMet)-specific endonuclease VapC